MTDLDKKLGPDLKNINNWIIAWIESTSFPPPKYQQNFRIDEGLEIMEQSIFVPNLNLSEEVIQELSEGFSGKPSYEYLNRARGFLAAHRGELKIKSSKEGGTEFIIQIRTGDPYKELRKFSLIGAILDMFFDLGRRLKKLLRS